MYKHTFDNTILRSYDIRGIYKKTLTEIDAFMLGFFFGTTVRKKNPDKKHPLIIIGMDGRLSSPILEQKLNEGLENSGCEILELDWDQHQCFILQVIIIKLTVLYKSLGAIIQKTITVLK